MFNYILSSTKKLNPQFSILTGQEVGLHFFLCTGLSLTYNLISQPWYSHRRLNELCCIRNGLKLLNCVFLPWWLIAMSHWVCVYLKCQFLDSKAIWFVSNSSAISIIICIKMPACVTSNKCLLSTKNYELLTTMSCLEEQNKCRHHHLWKTSCSAACNIVMKTHIKEKSFNHTTKGFSNLF